MRKYHICGIKSAKIQHLWYKECTNTTFMLVGDNKNHLKLLKKARKRIKSESFVGLMHLTLTMQEINIPLMIYPLLVPNPADVGALTG